jgi:nucleotide-binding universal stress UspA family protein
MNPFSAVLCAVDLGVLTGRVLYHAAGLASVLGVRLKVLHVAGRDSGRTQDQVAAICLDAVPYSVPINEEDIVLRSGDPATLIAAEAGSRPGTLIVVGSSGHSAFAKLLLGSTTGALFGCTQSPILLVPPTSIDIVTTGTTSALTCGNVIAAVDLAEVNGQQLRAASALAAVANSALYLMTVAEDRVPDHDAVQILRERGHNLKPVRPTAMIVRRGDVAEEIGRAASHENAGLAVMGLRDQARGRPGAIAARVLKSGKAFVLAVPPRA